MQDRPKQFQSLYDTDFFAWTQEQARLLADRRLGDLDIENLAAEVRSVGSSEKREIRNRLKVLLVHLLKWQYQPNFRGPSWTATIAEQRDALAAILEDSPSLADYMSSATTRAYVGATLRASSETGIAIAVFPRSSPYTPEQVLDPNFLPSEPTAE